MKSKRLIIYGNGILLPVYVQDISEATYIIGVDGAAHWLLTQGVVPDLAIGDFDSVTGKEFAVIKQKVKKVLQYPKDKDYTDMELAIDWAIKQSPARVVIYGGFGTRLDHSLVTVQMLEKFLKQGIPAVIRDSNNEAFLLTDKQKIPYIKKYRYLSLLPVTDSISVTLKGLVHSIKNEIIHRGQSLGISNEFTDKEATVEVHKGIVLVIRSRD